MPTFLRSLPFIQGNPMFEQPLPKPAPINLPERKPTPAPEPEFQPVDFSGLKMVSGRKANSDYMNYIYRSLKDRGMDDLHIATLLGTIANESGGDPFAMSPDGKFYGLLQWADDRYRPNIFGEDEPYREIDRQLNYLYNTLGNVDDRKSWTLDSTDSGYNTRIEARDAWDNADDLYKASHALNWGYVRPTGKDQSVQNRYKTASQIYNLMHNIPETPVNFGVPVNTMAEGGPVKRFDGESEPTGQMENEKQDSSYVKHPKLKRYVYGDNPDSVVRRRLYDNLLPYSYGNPVRRARNAVRKNLNYNDNVYFPESDSSAVQYDHLRDDLFAEYLQVPEAERHSSFAFPPVSVNDSEYRPTLGNPDIVYKTMTGMFRNPDANDTIIEKTRGLDYGSTVLVDGDKLPTAGPHTASPMTDLGTFTASKGIDPQKGEYVSIYDYWNIDPTSGKNARFPWKFLPIESNEMFGIGKPVEVYDRLYLDDYYNVNSMPDKGSYYGGYIKPSVVKAKQKRKKD